MAKKKDKYEAALEVPSSLDDYMEKVTNEAKKHYAGQVYSGDEETASVICLPVPAFSVRFLFQQEGLPLSRFFMVVGPKESYKSAFAVEMARWHRLCRGNGVKIQTENKPSPELHLSIMKWDLPAMKVHNCKTIEEWQQALDFWVFKTQRVMDGYKENDKKVAGVGRSFPVCYIVDSLTAVLNEKIYVKLEKEGSASRHFSEQASSITDYMKYMPTKLSGYPFTFIGINHLKEKADDMGNMQPQIPGGASLGYHETMELTLRRGARVNKVDEQGTTIKFEVSKNGMAPKERMSADVVWYIDLEDRDPVSGACRQKTWFDWHSASITVLHQLMGGAEKMVAKIGTKQARMIKELTELSISTENSNAWSKVMGVPEKKPVSFREMGELLEEKIKSDTEFRNNLYPLCGIRRRNMFLQGMDFREQTELFTHAAVSANSQDVVAALPFGVPNEPADKPAG